MTPIQTLVAALGDIPAYEPDVIRLYRERESHVPTPVERKRAIKQLKDDKRRIGELASSLNGMASQPARNPEAVWEFSL